MRFPIVAFENNVIFNNQGKAFAFYKLPSIPYRFFPYDRKEMCVGVLEEMLSGFSGQGQILLLWEELDINEGGYAKNCLHGGTGELGEELARHARAVRNTLVKGARTLRRYVLFELPFSTPVSGIQDFLNYMQTMALRAFLATRPVEIPRQLKEMALAAEQDVYARMRRFNLERATFEDLDFCIRKCSNRSGVLPPPLPSRSGGIFNAASISSFTDGKMLEESISHVAVLDGSGRVQHQSFVFFVDVPQTMPPSGIDIFNPSALGFPFDVAIHFTVTPPHQAEKKVSSKRRLLRAQMDEVYKAGDTPDLTEEMGLQTSQVLQAKIQSGKPLASMSVCLAVSSDSLKEVSSRASQLCDHFLQMNFRAVRPSAKQIEALFSFVPGAPPAAPMTECDPGFIASIGPHFASELGDPKGFFLGWSGQTPIFWAPCRPARELNKTNAVLVTGSLGGGKSYLSKALAYFVLLNGGYVLAIDPKEEYHTFQKLFGDRVRTVDLTPRGGAALNPFVLSRDDARAKGIAMDYLTLALNAAGNEARRLAIAQALERVFTSPVQERCLAAFRAALMQVSKESPHHAVKEEAAQGVFLLKVVEESDIGRMVFGKGESRFFDSGEKMIVLNIKEIPRPRPGAPAEKYTESERQGQAIIYLLAAVAREAAFGLPRPIPKMLIFDEVWVLTSISEGERLLDEVIRIGRTFNLIPALISQNMTDIGSEAIINNVGQIFCFRASSPLEVEANLRVLGADTGVIKPETFAGLRPGQCLHRDAEGRIGWLQVDVQPPYLRQVFDTRPDAELAGKGVTS